MADFFKKRIKDIETEETVLMGAKIPVSIVNYINLFCIADGVSKTSIILPLIEDWYKKASKHFSEKELIRVAVDKGLKDWENRKQRHLTFKSFILISKRTLKNKGLEESVVNKIIEKLEDAKDKKNKTKNK